MAISTYAELQTAIGSWLERSGDADVAAHVAEWITLGEAKLNRELRGLRVTTVDDATLTGTPSSRSIALPADFLTPVALYLTTSSAYQLLRPMVAGSQSLRTTSGYPKAWAVNGTNIMLDAPCDQAHTFTLRYHKKLNVASESGNSWLLTNFPDAYLQAGLEQAAIYFKDIPAAQGYGAILADIIESIRIHNAANYRSVQTVDPALLRSGGLTLAEFQAGDF